MSGPIGMTLQTKTLDRIISELTITKETGKGCVPPSLSDVLMPLY